MLPLLFEVGFHRYQLSCLYTLLHITAVSWLVLLFLIDDKICGVLPAQISPRRVSGRGKDIFFFALFRILTTEISKGFKRCGNRDQVSIPTRFEPSSRTFLNGEQPYAWDLLQPRAKVSRHRGAELRRRYGRLGGTSLLSPG